MVNVELLDSPHPFHANCYLISVGDEYAVVDPTAPFRQSLCNGKIKYILLTHAHFDHILEIDSWVQGTGAEVIISKAEQGALSDPLRNCYRLYNGSENGYFGPSRGLEDGETLPLGDKDIRIMLLPGHTVGSCAYFIDGVAFVGDTVFAGGGYGRFDLPTGSSYLLFDSIRRLLNEYEKTVLYPGHGDETTIKNYKNQLKF